MASKATSATRCNPIAAAVAIVALGGMLVGCADSAALMYAQETHAQKVAAWCHAYSGATTASLQEDCVRRVWINVPVSDYWIKHHSKVAPCRCGMGSGAALTSEVSAERPQQETVTPPDGTVKPPQ